ncbi:MAG: hypothetical protein QXI10_03685 [Candidatus Diapherotrites archaeon]
MQEKYKKILIGLALFFSILIWGSLIGFAGVLDVDWLSTQQASKSWQLFFSPLMIGFYLFFPITFGIISGLSHSTPKNELYIISILGSALGIISFFVMFGWSSLTLVFGALVFIAVLLTIETSYLFSKEMKSFVAFRTASNASNLGFIAIALGLMFFFVVSGIPKNEVYANEVFEKLVVETTNSMLGKIDLAEAEAEKVIEIQKLTLLNVMGSNTYKALENKQDKEVQAFVTSMNQTMLNLSDPKTKQRLVSEIKKNNELIKTNLSVDNIKTASPLVKMLFDFYVIIAAFSIASFVLAYFTIVGRNLAGFYGTITKTLFEALLKQKN